MTDITATAAKIGLVFPDAAEVYDKIAAVAITAGQTVYFNTSGKSALCDTNAAGAQQFRGVALNSAGAGQAVSVCKRGTLYGYDLSGLAYDALVYCSDTAGALADAAGTLTVNAGRVVPLSDSDLTKVLYIEADWLRTWA